MNTGVANKILNFFKKKKKSPWARAPYNCSGSDPESPSYYVSSTGAKYRKLAFNC